MENMFAPTLMDITTIICWLSRNVENEAFVFSPMLVGRVAGPGTLRLRFTDDTRCLRQKRPWLLLSRTTLARSSGRVHSARQTRKARSVQSRSCAAGLIAAIKASFAIGAAKATKAP